MVLDTSKCIACRACQVACKQWNKLDAVSTTFDGTYDNPPTFRGAYCRVTFHETEVQGKHTWLFTKRQCMHCHDAACRTVCPTGAIYRTDFDATHIDPRRCIGCNYCAANCPFDIIWYDHKTNTARKCTFCVDRVTSGQQPACVKTCPAGAIAFGEREDMVSQAKQRVNTLARSGYPKAQVYGLRELGGTGALYVLIDEPEAFGLLTEPSLPLTAQVWGTIFKPLRVLAVAALALGLLGNYRHTRDLQPGRPGSE